MPVDDNYVEETPRRGRVLLRISIYVGSPPYKYLCMCTPPPPPLNHECQRIRRHFKIDFPTF